MFTHLAIVDNPRYERANIVFNSKTVIENGGKGSGNFDHDGRPGEVGGSAPNNENVAQKYAQYNDLENDYKEFIAKEPENYDINSIDEVLKDLGITQNQPLKIKTPIENVNISVKSIEHIVGGGGESHPPDVTRFKSINKMLATLKDPMFINEVSGQKYYFKIFQNDDKSKKDIVIVSPDNEVFTNFPVDRSNWFFKTLKQGKTIYDIKNKRRKSDNNAAHVNNIITDNHENFNPDIKKHEVQNNKEQDMALLDELKNQRIGFNLSSGFCAWRDYLARRRLTRLRVLLMCLQHLAKALHSQPARARTQVYVQIFAKTAK